MNINKLAEVLFLTITLLLPIGLTGIGLISDRTFTNISLSDLLIVPLLFILIIQSCKRGSFLKASVGEINYIFYVVVFLLIAIFSIVNLIRFDGDVLVSIFNLFKLFICFAYGFIYLIYFENCDQKEWEKYVKYALLSGVIFSLTCILGSILFMFGIDSVFIDNYVNTYRATGLQEDPNTAAIFQIMTISYGLLYVEINRNLNKKKGYIYIAILFIGALTTASKSGILTIMATSTIITLLLFLSRMRRIMKKLIPLLVLGVVCLIFLAFSTSIFDTILGRLSELSSGSATTIMTNRNFQWKTAIDILLDNPLNLLMGIGIGQFENIANQYNLFTVSYSVHNTYLSLLIECGIFLFLLVVTFLLCILFKLSKNIIKYGNLFSLYAIWGVLAVSIFMASMNFQNNRMAYVFITFVCCGIRRISNRELTTRNNYVK